MSDGWMQRPNARWVAAHWAFYSSTPGGTEAAQATAPCVSLSCNGRIQPCGFANPFSR